jgi:fatty acid-binding protein DegV
VHVIDSRFVSMGLGLLAIAAARAAAAGQDAAGVVRLVETLIPRTNVIFTVETLEYMRRGGRIGGATALLGSVLDIKPVLCMRNGIAEPLEKQRTKKRAISRMLELMADRAPFIDQAASNNLYIPADVDKWDLLMLYFRAWELGIKSLYYLRSKSIQRAGFAGVVEADNTSELRQIEVEPRDYDECLACQ